MALTIGRRMEEDIAILDLAGSLTLGPSLVNLRKAAREALTTPKLCGVILELKSISSVDSSGLGELTIVYSSANRNNCPVRLVGVSSNLTKMLQMTHLDGVLISAPDLETAKTQIRKK